MHLQPRLTNGPSLVSYGVNCAISSGISADIIARALKYLDLIARGEDLSVTIHQLGDAERARICHAEQVAEAFCELDLTGSEASQRVRRWLASVLSINFNQ